jgi:heme/copper-type cytochrome/quinol oxidase subunit 2
MRRVILEMCAPLAAGLLAAMLLSIWSTNRAPTTQPSSRRRIAAELVWAAIPCLMLLAAAVPAVIAIVSAHNGD